jgi:hypothetical protein
MTLWWSLIKLMRRSCIGRKHKIMRTIPAEEHQDSWISYEFIDQEALKEDLCRMNQIQVGVKFDKAGDIPIPVYER